MSAFSQRHGYDQQDAPITIRNDAPDWLRSLAVRLAYEAGLKPSSLREILCELLLESPDPNNWSPSNVDDEVRGLLCHAEWFRVYDFIEIIVDKLEQREDSTIEEFTSKINNAFRRKGVGWQLVDRHIEI